MSLEITGFFSLIYFLIVVWALFKIINSESSTTRKVLWIILILVLPVFGLLAWLIFGPKG